MNIMSFFSITGLINFLAMIVLALFVYLKNTKSHVNIRFSIFCLSVAVWSFGYIFWPISKTKQETLFWFQVLHFGSNFISIAFFHFVITLLKQQKKKLLAFGYILSFIISFFIFTPYFLKGMRPVGIFPYWGIPGLFYYLFLLNFFGYCLISIFLLYKAYRASVSHKEKNQLKYILVGMMIGYLGGSTNFLLFFGIPFPPYFNSLIIVCIAILVYAIVAHNLLDINIIFKKTIVYSILASIITLIYFSLIVLLENVFRIYCGYKSFPVSFSVIILFVLLFQPLKNRIQKIIDKYFFHGTIDQIDEENIKLREELQKSEKLKAVATLAAGMAHEIKNPLTSIKTFTEYLSEKKNDPAFFSKFQKIVGGEVAKINNIVQQLLEFSKPKDLQLEEVSINNLLEETLTLLSNDFLKNNIKVERSLATTPSIKVDSSQMKQVFVNVLLNAIDSMKNGGIITVEAKVDKKISVLIEDTGTGIDKEDLKRIFDPFFSKKDNGTGLGLSVVHGIIEKHGGKINVESTPNIGTSFKITLPVTYR